MTHKSNIIAAAAIAALSTFSMTGIANAAEGKAAGAKSKNCVMFYSPRYKKLRIKPIQVSYRWCSAAKPTDCTKWKDDTIADVGKPFSVAAYCFTHNAPITMDLRYNRKFGENQNRVQVKIKPHAMKLKGDLAPHPFCAENSAHRFVMKRGNVSMVNGKPRDAAQPECVWTKTKKKAKPGA